MMMLGKYIQEFKEHVLCSWIWSDIIDPIKNGKLLSSKQGFKLFEKEHLSVRDVTKEEREYLEHQFGLIKEATVGMEFNTDDDSNSETDQQEGASSISIGRTVSLLHRLVGFWILLRLIGFNLFMQLCDSAALYNKRKVFELFEQDDIDSSNLLWYATFYLFLEFLFKAVNGFSLNYYYMKQDNKKIIISNSMQSMVLRKIAKLSYIQKLTKFNFGIVDTILGQDVWSVCSNMYDLPSFYSHIFYIMLCIVAIYDLIGFKATFIGMLFLFISSPFYYHFLKKREAKYDEVTKLCDKKSNTLSQFIQSIRLIKIYTLENTFVDKICKIQESFKTNLKSTELLNFIIDAIYYVQSFVVSSLCFFVYCYVDGNPLKLSTALTVVELADSLRYPLYAISSDLQSIMTKRLAIRRLGYLLNSPEHSQHKDHTQSSIVEIEKASASWSLSKDEDTHYCIQDVSTTIKKGEHIAIIGKVASGKSSLIYTILNETKLVEGMVRIKENLKISFVSQSPWIRNATIKENVIFGSSTFDKTKYESALFAADFKSDIEEMQNGEDQMIGERGINLSGGQKTRLALARALYHDCDLYIFDDIFSAVDIHTADNIIKRLFVGENAFLKDKTVLLSTHLLKLIPHMDKTIVMDKGTIVLQGDHAFLTGKLEETLALRELFESATHSVSSNVEENENSREDEALDEEEQDETEIKEDEESDTDTSKADGPSLSLIRQFLFSSHTSSIYLSAIVTFSLLEPLTGIFKDYILSEWSTDEMFVYHSITFYLVMYISQGFIQMFAITFNTIISNYFMYELADTFQEKLIKQISRTKLRYFEDIPSGKILDNIGFINTVRDDISYRLRDVFTNAWQALCSTFVVVFSFPLSIFMLFISVPITNYFRGIYTEVSNEIEQIESDFHDPTPTISAEMLDGLDTIRSYGNEKFETLITDINTQKKPVDSLSYCKELAWFWFYVRNDFFRDLISTCTVLGIFFYYFWNYDPNNSNIKTIQITISLFYVRTSELIMSTERIMYTLTKARTSFNCVQRVQKFSNSIQEENYGDDKKATIPESVSNEGLSVSFDNVSMRYREEQDLVVKNVTFSVAPGSKCAIIGRTASGKSSLFNCLLRFQEIESTVNSGIYLNGIDVKELSLPTLRSAISFIPQSPVLFLGTLRENLDFNNSNTDEEIWHALEQVGLVELLTRKISKESQSSSNVKEILDYSISENGNNFSCGEKQLICLARSILKKSKLLLMDEATANVDSFTDSQIQKTLRGPLFNNCTIITIAHRIETVKDYDRIILMKLGEIEMNDIPSQVLQYYVENYTQ